MKIFCLKCGFGNAIVGGIKPNKCSKCSFEFNATSKLDAPKPVTKTPSIVDKLLSVDQSYKKTSQSLIAEIDNDDVNTDEIDFEMDRLNASIEVESRFNKSTTLNNVVGTGASEEASQPAKRGRKKKINAAQKVKEILAQASSSRASTEI